MIDINKKIKKIALVDVDDVCIPFIEDFNIYLRTQRPEIVIDPKYLPKIWGYEELGSVSKEMNDYINGDSDKSKIFDGAVHFTTRLKELGFEIVLITAHPAHKLVERAKNLKSQGLVFDHLYCTAAFDHKGEKLYWRKSEFVEVLELNKDSKLLFVDDRANSVIDMISKFDNAEGFTMDRGYNHGDLNQTLFDKDAERLHVVGEKFGEIADDQVKRLYNVVLQRAGEL